MTLGSCAEDLPPAPPGAGQIIRLELKPQGGEPSNELVEVARYLPKRTDQVTENDEVVWSGVASEKAVFIKVRVDGTEAGKLSENRIPGFVVEGPGRKSISLKGEFKPLTFNQVAVRMESFGSKPEYVRVAFLKDGKERAGTAAIEVPTKQPGPHAYIYQFPQNRRLGGAFDELRIEFAGVNNSTAVAQVSLLQQPSHMLLPEIVDGETMLTLDMDARRGPVLSSERPLVGEFEAPAGSRLRFSYTLVDGLRMPGQKPELVLTLKSGAAETVFTYPLESNLRKRSTWESTSIDVDKLGTGPIQVHYSLNVEGDHDAYAVIAEPIVSTRGDHPKTVLLITSDTHRADHVGYAGGPVKTPILDAMAARGVSFSQAYTATNITNPSHIALMTSVHPRDTRIINNHTPLASEARTLAEAFREAGYRTFAATSAYHLAHGESGLGQGFDRLNAPRRNTRLGGVSVDVLEDWIEEADGEPLFVWLHVFDAHSPYAPPEPYDRRYYEKGKDPTDKDAGPGLPGNVDPPFLKDLQDIDFAYQQYRAAVDYVDYTVGRITELPRFAEGVIAFTADHGESFGHNGVWWDHAELFPSSTHVPLVLTYPGAPAGTVVDMAVRQIDVGRTLLDLAGQEDKAFPGRDLSAAAEGNLESQAFFGLAAHGMSAYLQSGGMHMILHLRFHKEWSFEHDGRYEHELELYNVVTDPDCAINLVNVHTKQAKAMRKALVKWLVEAPAQGLGREKNMTKDQREQLAGLGYAGEEVSEGALIDPGCACDNCAPYRD
ncbi:MAG: arylsulfatase [Planctomycetota bacterium]|jgi:arylsulfatase